jgi:hypothetical protein
MQTITQEEFEKKYGKEALNIFQDTKIPTQSALSRVGSSFQESLAKGKAQIQGTGEFAGQIAPQRGVELAATITGAPIRAVGSLLPQTVKDVAGKIVQPIGTGLNWLTDKISDSQALQDFTMKYPEATSALENLAKTSGALAETTGNIALTQGAISGTQQIAKATSQKAAQVTDNLINKTKSVFSSSKAKIGDQILPIPETVKTTLRRTSNDTLKSYVNQAKKAITDQKAMTPLEMAGEKAVVALEKVQKRLSSIGAQKSSIIAQSKVGNVPMGNVAVKARQNLLREVSTKTLDATDERLVNDIITRLTNLGANPKLKAVDEFIDYAQEVLYKGSKNLTLPVGGRTEAILKNTIGTLNKQVKDIAPKAYTSLNAKYADIVDVRNTLNQALGVEATKGGSLMKRVFSPTDAGTKKMFAEVKSLTGIDLTDEAVLAKFTMDLFGDARQASLLQQLNIPSQRGIIEKAIQATGKVAGFEDWLKEATIKRALKIK